MTSRASSAAPNPTELLDFVSALITTLDPRSRHPFGVGNNPAQRAQTFLRAVDAPSTYYSDARLGSARYLVSATRSRLAEDLS